MKILIFIKRHNLLNGFKIIRHKVYLKWAHNHLPAVLPGQRCVGSSSRCPAVLCSVYPAALRPSAGELKLQAVAETPALPLKPGPLLDEPEGVGERWEGKMYWWHYIKIKATEMVEQQRNKPGWVSAGASSVSLWKENGERWLMKRKQKDKKRNKVSWGASERWWKRVIQWLQSDWDEIGGSHSSLC